MKKFDWSLYLVTDEQILKGRSFSDVIYRAVQGGVTAVQVRHKTASDGDFLTLTREITALLAGTPVPVIVNDRAGLVIDSGADGLHIGQEDLPYESAREKLPAHYPIGLSLTKLSDLEKYEGAEPDYFGAGPVFPTSTKKDAAPAAGCELLRALRAVINKPLIAIGGIGTSNASLALKAGADGIAVVSAICGAADPRRAAAELSNIVKESGTHRRLL